MSGNLTIDADVRCDLGKAASRRLRRTGYVPAILYGAGLESQNILLDHKKVMKALENHDFFSQILDLEIEGKSQRVVLKDLQRHVFKERILHMDFLRVKENEEIVMNIPLNFVGIDSSPGVKLGGGIVSKLMSEVEVKCLPANLPKSIEVDISDMQLNDIIYLSDLELKDGVELTVLAQGNEYDQPVVTVSLKQMSEEVLETEEGRLEREQSDKEAEDK